MSELVVRAQPPRSGVPLVDVTAASAGWGHVGFAVHRLEAGDVRSWGDAERELCVVVLGGQVRVDADGIRATLGRRADVFDGPPEAAYVPAGSACRVEAVTAGTEIALCWAPGTPDAGFAPLVIQDVVAEERGEGIARRTVHPILMDDRPAQSLLVVEVLTPAGHWSSFPPHRHDRDDPPHETSLEETYYHRLRPERGFGLQRVYTDDRSLDETIAFGNGDVVLVPRGYHVVAAMPGYDLYYLNVMAGPVRAWRFVDDADHAWLRAGPAVDAAA